MTGIDFADTVVVRRTTEKGTKIIREIIKKQNWAGQEFKNAEKERLRLAGEIRLASSKGTKTIDLSQMRETKIPSSNGVHLSTNKGTNFRVG